MAAQAGNENILRLLLLNGANKNTPDVIPSLSLKMYGITPLQKALAFQNFKVADLILKDERTLIWFLVFTFVFLNQTTKKTIYKYQGSVLILIDSYVRSVLLVLILAFIFAFVFESWYNIYDHLLFGLYEGCYLIFSKGSYIIFSPSKQSQQNILIIHFIIVDVL